MLAMGLIDEVNQLKKMGLTEKDNALNTVGYKEVLDHQNGKFDFDTMVEKIKTNSRRYAKRQLTWFRKDGRIVWLNIDEFETNEDLTNQILSLIKNRIK
jgi:tRNA dimethylallyltransferase